MERHLELGLDTFGDVTFGDDGKPLPQPQVIRNVVEEAVLAERVGLDFIGVGEHHRPDFAVSAPEVVLAAIAARTSRIRLGSAVTVLSTDDPVRVYERFATVDALSNGRAEVVLGRGSFTESYPLFGFELEDYERLFEEKLARFAQLRDDQAGHGVYPLTAGGALPTWVGVGGSPESVVRAARYGFPLAIAIIGGSPARFAPLVDLYHRALDELGQPRQPITVHSPGYVAETDDQAREEAWPHHSAMQTRIGRERGWPPMSRAQYEASAGPEGALFVGSPDTVAAKVARVAEQLQLSRFDLKYSLGTLPHDRLLRSIDLFGTEVAPRVRRLLEADAA
jgi:probable LLM family oxidoreductase